MKRLLHPAAAAAVALALGLVASAATNDFHLRIAFMVCVYYLCAAGMGLLVGFAGQKSLGQAALFAAGAYTAALLTVHTELNAWLVLAISAVVAAACGALVALPALRVRGPYLAMVTLAFGIVAEKLVTEWTDVFGGAQGLYGVRPLTWNDESLGLREYVWLALALSLVTYLLVRNLVRGRIGRALLSLQADEIAAASVGVRVYGYKVFAFTVAALTCGLAGALVALQTQYINSDFINLHLSIFILLLVLFGGSHSVYGPIAGAVVLTLTDALLAQWPAVQHFVYGAVLLFALYVMPGGLVGALEKLRGRRAPAPAPAAASGEIRFAGGGSGELLAVEKLCKSFGGVHPAQDVSFRLERGQIHALIGPNGAGKSTMINMITGVIRPSSGRIVFAGKDVAGAPAHRLATLGLARTFQNLRLFADLTVLENVMLGRHVRMRNGLLASLLQLPRARHEEEAARAHAMALLQMVDLAHLANARAGSLPYGLQRRLELARALASDPQLLLLDEPAAGLNPQETHELGDLLLRISRLGMTILMVEHHMDLVMRISDHVIVLDYGVKIADGTPAQVQEDPAVIAAYLGIEEDAAPAGA